MKLNRTPNPLDRNARNDENDNWEKIEGSIKRIDDTVSDLILESGGDSNLEVVQARGGKPVLNDRLADIESQLVEKANDKEVRKKTDYIGLDDFDSTTLLAIEGGEGTEFNLLSIPRDNSVTIEKTDFIERSNSNLFSGRYENGYVSNGEGNPLITGNGGRYTVSKIKPNTTYSVKKTKDTDRFIVALFSESPRNNVTSTFYTYDNANEVITVESGSQDKYIVVSVSSRTENKIPEKLIISEGSIVKEVPPNQFSLSNADVNTIPDQSISIGKVDFVKKGSKNLFDFQYHAGFLSGEPPYQLITTTGNGRYALVKVKPNTSYTITKSKDSDRFRIGVFSDKPVDGSEPSYFKAVESNGETLPEYTLNVGEDGEYIVIVVSSTSTNIIPSRLQVEEGDTATTYEPEYILDDSKVGLPSSNNKEIIRYRIFGDLISRYNPTDNTLHYSDMPNVNDLYDKYDQLMNKYPEYITKEKIGEDTTGLAIYRYDFKPPSTRGSNVYIPKFLYTNLHSSEKTALTAGVRFFTDLCNDWENQTVLSTLRWNIHFIVVPTINPYGWNEMSYRNANGVNLNRNFPVGWVSGNDSGSGPASEVETQVMMNLVEGLENVIYAIDHHNYDAMTNSDEYVSWLASASPKVNELLDTFGRCFTGNIYSKYDGKGYIQINNDSAFRLIDDYGDRPARMSNYFNSKGIPAQILEIVKDVGNDEQSTIDMTTDILGNLIVNIIREIHRDYKNFIIE